MGLIVQKFGGSSVADAAHIDHVADIIADTYQAGNNVIVVLSAQGDTTDDLIAKANEINPNASRRELDMLLSTGEQISIALCAMALEKRGLPVISLVAWQVGIQTSNTYNDARIRKISKERIQAELDKKNIVIVAGFQGINSYGDVTTLGRGGSDTSAVALAAAFHANLCQIYTDVDGVYTADPRVVKNARKLPEITYADMLEMASQGAQVLHNRSVELAKKYHVNMEVMSSLHPVPGTKVKEVVKVEKTNIGGVAKMDCFARVSLVGLEDRPGVAFKVFSLLSKNGVNIDIILQSVGRNGSKDISFTCALTSVETAEELLAENRDSLGYDKLEVDRHVAKISLIGAGMLTHVGVASDMFEALYDAGINIQMISTSEIRISVLVSKDDANRAVKVVHDKFFGADD